MSDALKWELAHELGVEGIVATEGWGGVSARNCGNLVKLAIQYAEEALARDYAAQQARSGSAYRQYHPVVETRQSRPDRERAEVAPGYAGPTGYRPPPGGYGADYETGLAAHAGGPGEAFPYWAVEHGPAELRG